MEQPQVCTAHQAVLPSALASSSTACMKVAGSTSRPSQLFGSSMRKSRASCSAASTSGASSRSLSARAACAEIRGASSRARAKQSPASLCVDDVRSNMAVFHSALERDDLSLNRHPTLASCFEHDLFRKPLHTFRDHALGNCGAF